jgi:hypothetical protein
MKIIVVNQQTFYMKTTSILVMLCTWVYLNSSAQNIQYGFHSGININSAYGSALSKEYKRSLTGASIGGHIKFNITPYFGIQLQPQYDQNGWTYRNLYFATGSGSAIGQGEVVSRLSYINLPVLAQYEMGKKIKFHIVAGGFAGVLLKNMLITNITDPAPPNETSTSKSKSNSRRSINAGISFGAGLQIPAGKKLKIDIQVLDNYGLANINKPGNMSPSTIKTNALGLLAGISLPLCNCK